MVVNNEFHPYMYHLFIADDNYTYLSPENMQYYVLNTPPNLGFASPRAK